MWSNMKCIPNEYTKATIYSYNNVDTYWHLCHLLFLSFLENTSNFFGQQRRCLNSNWQAKFPHTFSPRIISLQHVLIAGIKQMYITARRIIKLKNFQKGRFYITPGRIIKLNNFQKINLLQLRLEKISYH